MDWPSVREISINWTRRQFKPKREDIYIYIWRCNKKGILVCVWRKPLPHGAPQGLINSLQHIIQPFGLFMRAWQRQPPHIFSAVTQVYCSLVSNNRECRTLNTSSSVSRGADRIHCPTEAGANCEGTWPTPHPAWRWRIKIECHVAVRKVNLPIDMAWLTEFPSKRRWKYYTTSWN